MEMYGANILLLGWWGLERIARMVVDAGTMVQFKRLLGKDMEMQGIERCGSCTCR